MGFDFQIINETFIEILEKGTDIPSHSDQDDEKLIDEVKETPIPIISQSKIKNIRARIDNGESLSEVITEDIFKFEIDESVIEKIVK